MDRSLLSRFTASLLIFSPLLLPCEPITTEGTLWTSIPDQTVRFNTPEIVPLVRNKHYICLYMCLHRNGCRSFCHDANSAECYVSGIVTSLEVEAPPQLGLTCFGLCPQVPGYKMFAGRCIKLVQENDTYSVAKQRCEGEGGHLHYVKVLMLDALPIFQLMEDNGVDTDADFHVWLGADDMTTPAFTWSDGSTLSFSSDVWAPGKPTQAYPSFNCLIFRRNTFRVEDRGCGQRYWSICQTDL